MELKLRVEHSENTVEVRAMMQRVLCVRQISFNHAIDCLCVFLWLYLCFSFVSHPHLASFFRLIPPDSHLRYFIVSVYEADRFFVHLRFPWLFHFFLVRETCILYSMRAVHWEAASITAWLEAKRQNFQLKLLWAKAGEKKKSRISISISRRLSEQKFQHNFITLAICIICTCDTKAVMWNTFEIFHLHLLNRAMRCLLLSAHVSRWNDWQSIRGAFFIRCIVWICQSRFHRFHWHSSQYDVLMRFLYLS